MNKTKEKGMIICPSFIRDMMKGQKQANKAYDKIVRGIQNGGF